MTNKQTKTPGQRRKETLSALCKELKTTLSGGNECAVLKNQAQILDKIFLHTLSEANENDNLCLFSLALRAQNNYRRTIITLYRIEKMEKPRKNDGANYTNSENSPNLTEQTIHLPHTKKINYATLNKRNPRISAENDNERSVVNLRKRRITTLREKNGSLNYFKEKLSPR